MKRIVFNVDKLLKTLGVSANYVAVQAKIAPHTVSAYRDNTVKRIEIDTLELIIHTLNEISIEKGMGKITLEDVVSYK
jgi:DNA-binding Xre family transcriptional regulator